MAVLRNRDAVDKPASPEGPSYTPAEVGLTAEFAIITLGLFNPDTEQCIYGSVLPLHVC